MRLLNHSNTELVVKVRYFAPPDSELSELKEKKMREGGEVREDQAGVRLLCWFGFLIGTDCDLPRPATNKPPI